MKQFKTVILDIDGSLSAIGSYDTIAKVMGIRPKRVTGGLTQFSTYLRKLCVKNMVPVSHPLFEDEKDKELEEVWELTPAAKAEGLEIIVADSISMLGQNERSIIGASCTPNSRGMQVMDKMEWQYYGDRMNRVAKLIAKLPITVVCTSHLDHDKVEATGVMIDVPGVKGANKYELARHFDVVLYCHVILNMESRTPGAKVESKFYWQTKPDERRPMAKDRLNLLPAIMDQDLGLVIRTYLEHGIQPKILIVGDTGQGKTTSIKSINVPYDKILEPINPQDNGGAHAPTSAGN